MKLLAIDTASHLCAACVYDTERGVELGRSVADIGKGHAEQLMATIGEAMAGAGIAFGDLGRIAVSIGPGSFTGIRVGVSAARGFALALGIPSFGVTTLDAVAAEARDRFPGRAVMSVLDGGRGETNVAVYDELAMLVYGPAVTDLGKAAALAMDLSPVLAGSAAMAVAEAAARPFDIGSTQATADIAVYARLASGMADAPKPRPLYLRDADAKPQAGFVLPRKGG